MACDRCGLPHERCAGHNRANKPCGLWPLAGQRVCDRHGGKSPQALAAAERRQAEAAAEETIRDLWPGLANAAPVKDPLDLLARTAGALEHMADVVGARVNELQGKVAGGEHLSQLRGEVVLLDRLLDKLLKAGDRMASLGIASRAVEVQQGQADLMLSWLRAGFEAGAAAGVSREQLDVVLAGFLGAMRRSRAGVVVGELEQSGAGEGVSS